METDKGVIDTLYLANILRLMREDPNEAANRLDIIAQRLMNLAAKLREQNGTRDRGGTNDRVQLAVVGPNGEIKQKTDTGIVS